MIKVWIEEEKVRANFVGVEETIEIDCYLFDTWLRGQVTEARFDRMWEMYAMGLESEVISFAKKFMKESLTQIYKR
jgi:hypothetical protein